MSTDKTFADFQRYKCLDIEVEDLAVDLPKFCPSCEKDPSYVEPIWYSTDEPYLDKKNCLYKVNITQIIKDLRLDIEDDKLKTYSITFGNHSRQDRDYKSNPVVQSEILRTAVYQLLINYDKELKFKHICNTLNCDVIKSKPLSDSELEKLEEVLDSLKFLKKSIIEDIEDGDNIIFEQDDYENYFEYTIELDDGEVLSPILTVTLDEYNRLLQERKSILEKTRIPIDNFNPYGLENHAIIEKVHYPANTTAGTMIQFLVSVPAFCLDRIPSTSQADDDDDEKGETFIIEARKLRKQLRNLSSAMYLYTLQYAVARRLDGTALYYKDKGLKEYEFEYVSKQLKTFPADGKIDFRSENPVFFERLKDALYQNKFRVDNFQIGAMFYKLAHKIKFKVNENADEPFQITKIFVETKECRFKRLKGGHAKRLIRYLNNNRFVSVFLSQIKQIENEITAARTPEWSEFLPKYAYPPVVIQKAKDKDGVAASDDRVALECLFDEVGIDAIGSGQIRNFFLEQLVPLQKLLAFTFNQRACFKTNDISDENPTSVKFSDVFGADAYKSNKDRFYQQEVDKILSGEKDTIAGINADVSEYTQTSSTTSDSLEGLSRRLATGLGIRYEDILEALETEADTASERRVDAQVKQAKEKGGNFKNLTGLADGKPGSFFTGESGHPMLIEATELAKLKMQYEDSFLKDIIDLKNGKLSWFGDGNDDGKFQADLFSFFGICGYSSLISGVIECLLGGLSFEQFVAKFVESAIKSLSVEQLGLFVDGLPPEAQAQVYAEVQEALGTLVKPWEAGGGFTTNTVSEVASGQPLKFDTSDKALSSDEISEFSEVPKELSAWNDLPREKKREAIDTYGRPRVDVDNPDFTGDFEQSTIGKAANDIVGTFVRAYTTAILNTLDFDILLDKIKDFPGAMILKKILFQFACMTPPLMHPPISEALKSFSFQVCNPVVGFQRPILSRFNLDLSWGAIFKALKEEIIEQLKNILKEALWALLGKVLELIDSLLCRALAGVGKFAGNYLADAVTGGGQGMSFHTAMREAFCGPDVPQAKVDQLSDELLAGLGYVPNDLNVSDVDPQFISNPNMTAGSAAAAIIGGTFTKDDLLYHMSADPNDYDTTLLRMAARSINATSPQMGRLLGTPDQLNNFFQALSNFLTPAQRQRILDSLENPSPPSPVNTTLCLTNEQYNDWVDRRERLFEVYGLPEGIPTAQDEDVAEDLADLLDAYINPNGVIEEGINNLMKQPICEDGEGIIPRDTPETRQIANQVTDDIFDNLRMAIYRDLLGNKGYLNELLADTEGKSLRRHRFRTFFSRRYVNAEEEATKRRSKGYFPETVGLHLKNQIENQHIIFNSNATGDETLERKINSSVRKKFELYRNAKNDDTAQFDRNPDKNGDLGKRRINIEIPARRIHKPKANLYFSDEIENPYTFTINYSDQRRNNPIGEMWTELSIQTQLGEASGDSTIYRDQSFVDPHFEQLYGDTAGSSQNPRLSYFKALMNKKIKVGAPTAPDFGSSLKNIYYLLNQAFLQQMCNDIVKNPTNEEEISNGFKFGYKAETLTEDDLKYVDPEPGATEYTYRHREAVLGRSLTNNPRVTFLDPEIYGGRYTNPPYIIEPSEHSGWYGFSTRLIPSHKFCDKKDVDIINFKYIKNQVNFYYNNLPTDERLQQEKECVVEPPFGKIANRNTKSSLHGIVTAIIRMYLAQGFMNGFPIFANVAFNSNNFSDIFYRFILDILESDLSDTPDRDIILVRTKIMKENYFLLFLEQVVESYQRLIDFKGVRPPKDVTEALNIIRNVQAFYKQPDFSDIDSLKDIPEDQEPFTLDIGQNDYNLILERRYKKFFKHALAYQSFGEAIFFSNNKVELMRLRKTDRYLNYFRMANKIFCVRLLKKQCMLILTEFMKYESDKQFRVLNKKIKPKPQIDSIVPYMLQNDKLCVNPKHKYGLRKPIDELAINGEADFGEVHDVQHDIELSNPLQGLTEVEEIQEASIGAAAVGGAAVGGVAGAAVGVGAAAYSNNQARREAEEAAQSRINEVNKYGRFIIQRYVRVKDKEEMPLAVANRDAKLFEIVNMQKFQDFLGSLNQTKKISDYFGNLKYIYSLHVSEFVANGYTLADLYDLGLSEDVIELDEEALKLTLVVRQEDVSFDLSTYEPGGIEGETGLSYGLRICYFPPSGMPLASQEVSNTLAVNNKAFNLKGIPQIPNASFMIPLVSAEVEMVDQTLGDINFFDGDNAFDLLCLFRELEEDPEYKFLFNEAIAIKSYMSMFAIYSNLGFQASWGLDGDEREDPPEENEEEDEDELDLDGDGEEFDFDFYEKSRKRARRIFANFYDQNDFFDNESAGNDSIFEFMLNFNPFRFRLPFRIPWWKRRRKRDYRCDDN